MGQTKTVPKKRTVSAGTVIIIALLVIILAVVALNGPFHLLLQKLEPTQITSDPRIGASLDGGKADTSTEMATYGENTTVEVIKDTPANTNYLSADAFTTDSLTSDDVHNGDLILVDGNHPFLGTVSNFTQYTTDTVNHCFYISSFDLSFQSEMMDNLNELTAAYVDEFENQNIFIYNTNVNDTSVYDLYPDIIAERTSGYSVDLALRSDSGAVALTDDVQNWISENCAKYGFVVRYTDSNSITTGINAMPYHLRYVGKANAALMNSESLSLEEYIEYIKNYTYDNPRCFSANNHDYEVFYVASTGDSTEVPVPKSNQYYISGNNEDGFIEIIVLN